MEKMSHGIVSQAVYSGVQVGRSAAARARNCHGGSSAGDGSQPQRTASLAQGVPARTGQCVSRSGAEALGGRADGGARAQDRAADAGDRFFERVLAAHRRAADAAGIEWKSAVYGQVREEMKATNGLTIGRMVELGQVSRSSFDRFDPERKAGADRDMELRDAIQRIALEWPCYGRPRITQQLRRRCVGRSDRSRLGCWASQKPGSDGPATAFGRNVAGDQI